MSCAASGAPSVSNRDDLTSGRQVSSLLRSDTTGYKLNSGFSLNTYAESVYRREDFFTCCVLIAGRRVLVKHKGPDYLKNLGAQFLHVSNLTDEKSVGVTAIRLMSYC